MDGTRSSFDAAARASFSSFSAGNDGVSFGFLLRQSAAAIDRGRALRRAGSDEARLAAWGARLVGAIFQIGSIDAQSEQTFEMAEP